MSNMATVVNSHLVNVHTISPLSSDSQVSDAWHQALQARLLAQEKIHASLEINLDEQLNYAKHLILLTNQRLIGLTWPALEFCEYPSGGGFASAATRSRGHRMHRIVRRRDTPGLVALHHGTRPGSHALRAAV